MIMAILFLCVGDLSVYYSFVRERRVISHASPLIGCARRCHESGHSLLFYLDSTACAGVNIDILVWLGLLPSHNHYLHRYLSQTPSSGVHCQR